MAIAIIVLFALVTINLLLSLATVVRVQKGDSKLIGRTLPPPNAVSAQGLSVGRFSSEDLDGNPISSEQLTGTPTLFGAFAMGCSLCEDRLPSFVATAMSSRANGDQVLVLVVGDRSYVEKTGRNLSHLARIVVEKGPNGDLAKAFGIVGYPAFARIDHEGRIVRSGFDVADVA